MSPFAVYRYHQQQRSGSPPLTQSPAPIQDLDRPSSMRRNSWPPALSLLHFDQIPSTLNRIPSPSLLSHFVHKHPTSRLTRRKSEDSLGRSFEEVLDEDPFSHFLSPLADDEIDDEFLALSAGIVAAPATSPSASIRAHQSEVNSSARGQRARQTLRGRWERYVERHHPNVQEHLQQHRRRKQQELDDEEYRRESGEPHKFIMPSPPRSSSSSPFEPDEGYESTNAASPHSLSDAIDIPSQGDYYTLSSGKRVKLESHSPQRRPLFRSKSTQDPALPSISLSDADVNYDGNGDLILEDTGLASPERTPSPTLGHAATIMSNNEKLRRQNRSRGTGGSRKKRRLPYGRSHSWIEPGWGMYPLLEEGEE